MKAIFTALAFFASANALAATPFTVGGDKIAAIYASEQIWRKIGGAVETIVQKAYDEGTTTYAVTTTESRAIMEGDYIVGFRTVPCLLMVDVTNMGHDEVVRWEVTNVDFTACPDTIDGRNRK